MSVELALALPVLGVLLAGCLWAVAALGTAASCADAARAAARAAARGDQPAQVSAVAERLVPGAEVEVSDLAGGFVEVRVRVSVPGPGWDGLQVGGRAVARIAAPLGARFHPDHVAVGAFGEEPLEPCLRQRCGVGPCDADRFEAALFRFGNQF